MTREDLVKIDDEVKANQSCLAHTFDGRNCSGGTILSHSIARSEQLKLIAENSTGCGYNNDICKSFHAMDINNKGKKALLKPWTIKKASTFKGVCNYHDTLLFNRIDKPIATFDKEVLLQLHYRAVSYEYFQKKISIELYEKILSDDDAYCNPSYKVIRQTKERDELVLKDLEREKDICEKNFSTKNSNNEIKATVFSFDTMVPIMCTGGWVPTHTVDGKQLFVEDMTSSAPLLGLTLGIDANSKSFFALTYTDDKNSDIQKFIESLKSFINKRFLDTVVLFCLQKSQNACCRPSWYNNLAKWQKDFINRGFNELNESKNERVVGVKILNQTYRVNQII